jgi:glycosyltransferase involved in cell wall biosynthesis
MVGDDTLLWVSSPYADGLVERAKPHIQYCVYDCMDDLASFKDGTPEMRGREQRLLGLADLIFTGGYSMYAARKDLHPHVVCFPSGVDVAHYRQVQHAHTPVAAACTAIPHPQLGFFGVLDERIDWDLIAEVATRRPDRHWVLVGPTAKIDPADLPQAANIHYLGKQAYADLPGYLKSFDIATMPFALNEATRFISPTKTLEYLAGGKPVISSSVADVVAFYRDIVTIADGPAEWMNAIEAHLHANPAELQARNERAQPLLLANTWDAIAARMAEQITACWLSR